MKNLNLKPIFPTFIAYSKFPDHHKYDGLFGNCFDLKQDSPKSWTGKVFTTLHRKDSLVNTNEIENNLSTYVLDCLQINGAYVSDIWYNVYHTGYYQERHHHCEPGVIFSGIYFHKNSTSPVFWNRDASIISSIGSHKYLADTPFHNIRMGDVINLNINDGDIIIFPPDLEHEVPYYTGDNPRITFSFNISHV